MKHLDAEALRALSAHEPEAVAYFREHLAHPCEECMDFLAKVPGPGLLDGQVDALLLQLAPARQEEPRLDEVGFARVRRGMRGPTRPWLKVGAAVALAAGLAGLMLLPRAQHPTGRETGAWNGVKGVGRLALEMSVVAREPDGDLRRMDPGAIASEDDVLVLRYHATEAGEALLFQQRDGAAPELLGRFPLEAGTHELEGPQGLVGISLEGESGPLALWLVGFPSGQVPPPDEVRDALTRGDMEESAALAINRFELQVGDHAGQNPRPR
ncbi:hypothetical protein [Vitiosangium sp. GDMCC 1.1324]|uniref:hypothetical protein n=1 Tax=Vitiosangium sp. (strain GDMCC 1.1324) TaxID=2138576 RepID=UPI000D35CAC4|nr:hypothetical protein [Vitiosangium sp. GDMCC 1.1324]PTL82603.1 hypothetical protein DAT35_17550 [Vitiosangium sp. GDMCC 1.1324]